MIRITKNSRYRYEKKNREIISKFLVMQLLSVEQIDIHVYLLICKPETYIRTYELIL
jgi:hypothetical protein